MSYAQDLQAAIKKNQGYGGGIMRIAKPDEVIWQGATGTVTDAESAPIKPSDTFEIASVTKTFTAVVTMQLVEEGRLGFNQTLGELVPDAVGNGLLVLKGHDYGPEITVRQLLAQRSGLPDYWYDPPFVTPETNAFSPRSSRIPTTAGRPVRSSPTYPA